MIPKTLTTLSKDQVRKVPAEQQEAVSSMELQRIRTRQQILERASRGMSVWAGLWTGLAGGLAILSTVLPRVTPFAILAVIILVGLHASRLYRRLDAMIDLLDSTAKERKDDDRAA